MKILDLTKNIGELPTSEDLPLISQINAIVSRLLRAHHGDIYPRTTDYGSFQALPASAIGLTSSGLMALVQDVRTRCLSNVFMRGTAKSSSEEAHAKGVISTKKVDDYFEEDVGLVSAYRIVTGANNLSNENFVYLLFTTVLSSLKYAWVHSVGGDLSITLFIPKTHNIGSEWDIRDSLNGTFTPEISKDHGREDFKLGNRYYPVFKENTKENAFKNTIIDNDGVTIYVSNGRGRIPENMGRLDLDLGGISETHEFMFRMAHILTLQIIREIGELRGLRDLFKK